MDLGAPFGHCRFAASASGGGESKLKLFSRQPVTRPHYSLDDERVRRVALDLAAQAIDYILQHRVIGFSGIPPDLLV